MKTMENKKFTKVDVMHAQLKSLDNVCKRISILKDNSITVDHNTIKVVLEIIKKEMEEARKS